MAQALSISSVVPRWVSPGGTHLLMSVGHQSMSTWILTQVLPQCP
jgi:hypothetical protein